MFERFTRRRNLDRELRDIDSFPIEIGSKTAEFGGKTVDFAVYRGDLTKLNADAFVVPVNARLGHIIQYATGELFDAKLLPMLPFSIEKQLAQLGVIDPNNVPFGFAFGVELRKSKPAKAIIHVNSKKDEYRGEEAFGAQLVWTENILKEADRLSAKGVDIKSIAIPSLRTDYFFGVLDANIIHGTYEAIEAYLENHPDTKIEKVSIVFNSLATTEKLYQQNKATIESILSQSKKGRRFLRDI